MDWMGYKPMKVLFRWIKMQLFGITDKGKGCYTSYMSVGRVPAIRHHHHLTSTCTKLYCLV